MNNPNNPLVKKRIEAEALEKEKLLQQTKLPSMVSKGDLDNSQFTSKPVIGARKAAVTKKNAFFSDSDDDFAPPVKKPA